MSKPASVRTLSFLLIFVLLSGLIIIPNAAQTSAMPQQAATTAPNVDDADDLPVYINVVGYVQSVTQADFVVNGVTIIIPVGIALPSGVAVGKVVSLRGNLRDDDKITLLYVVIGYHLPTPTAMPPATAAPTAAPTLEATEPASPPPTLPAAADCAKPRQNLAVMISAAYRVTYNEVIRLHCGGYTFGMIARSYVLVFAGKDAGKDLSVETILVLRLKHHRWSVIIVLLGVHPDSTLVVLVFDGGRSTVLFNCGSGPTLSHTAICSGITLAGGGGGGGNPGKTGKGHKGDDDDQGEDD